MQKKTTMMWLDYLSDISRKILEINSGMGENIFVIDQQVPEFLVIWNILKHP